MLHKLIDNSTDEHLWIWIADIDDDRVDILYGRENYRDDSKWIPYTSSTPEKDACWSDWNDWHPHVWLKEPLSYEEFFAIML